MPGRVWILIRLYLFCGGLFQQEIHFTATVVNLTLWLSLLYGYVFHVTPYNTRNVCDYGMENVLVGKLHAFPYKSR